MKKIKITFILTLTCGYILFAQNKKDIDSLQRIIPTLPDTSKFDVYGKLAKIYTRNNRELAQLYLDSVNLISLKIDKPNYYGRAYGKMAGLEKFYRNNTLVVEYLEKAAEYFQEAGNDSVLSSTYNNIGIMQRRMGMYEKAIQNGLKSIKLLERLNANPIRLAMGYTNIGTVHALLLNHEQAHDYFLKAQTIYKEENDERRLVNIWNRIAVNYKNENRFEEALLFYKKALLYYEKTNNESNIALLNNNIGSVYIDQDSIQKAIPFYEKAYKISKKINNPHVLSLAARNLGLCKVRTKEFRSAVPYYFEALSLDSLAQKKVEIAHVYEGLALSFAGLGNFEKAYQYKTEHFNRIVEVLDSNKVKAINELEIKYQTEKKEAAIALQEEEIKTLNEKAKVNTLTKGLYAGGMAAILGLFGLSVFGFRQRIKKNRIAREKQEEIYKQEIAHKKKELTSQTLHLVQKNTFIQELMQNLEHVKNSPDKFKTEFRRIVMLLKKENASDKDWEVFKTYFAEVHNDFDQKLKTIASDISEKEIRLAAFLRMNLTTKEIAATLNVLPDSILKSKYRLKKKLGIDKEIDLTSFLNTL